MGRNRKRSRSRSGGKVSRRSLLLLAGMGTAGATGAYTTGAFDAVTGDRALGVGTAGDGTALLGIDRENPSGADGETVALFTITNRFGSDLTRIDAEIVDGALEGPVDPNTLATPHGIPAGGSGVIEGKLSCSGEVERTIEVAIEASSTEQSVDLTRSVTVNCTVPERGPCAPLHPPGCVDDEFPGWEGTDCSVVIETSGEREETVGDGVGIGGAVDLTTDDEVDLTVRGTIADYLGIDTSGEIDVLMSGGGSIGGPLQVSTSDEVKLDIKGNVGGGLCVDESGELDVSVGGGGTVDGELSLTSSDEVSVDLDGDASVGPLSVETADEVDIGVTGGSEINGRVDVETSDEVKLEMDGNERVRGDVSITTEDEVKIKLKGSSVIEGDLTIETDDEVDVSGCRNIEGEVTPSGAC